jgi:DNA-binding XRE family transcriptional regulator
MLDMQQEFTHYVGKVNSKSKHFTPHAICGISMRMTTETHPWADVGERLKWHRKAIAQLSQREYSKRAGLNPTQYANWETGLSHPSMGGALKLLRTYRLSIDFIVEGNPSALPANLYRAWLDRPSQSKQT